METIKHVIVGTAGHIDHGKSSLVEALTGTNPDRLEEEKRRGITLDLGFAFLELDGVRLGLADRVLLGNTLSRRELVRDFPEPGRKRTLRLEGNPHICGAKHAIGTDRPFDRAMFPPLA
jgi:hypothetical protein